MIFLKALLSSMQSCLLWSHQSKCRGLPKIKPKQTTTPKTKSQAVANPHHLPSNLSHPTYIKANRVKRVEWDAKPLTLLWLLTRPWNHKDNTIQVKWLTLSTISTRGTNQPTSRALSNLWTMSIHLLHLTTRSYRARPMWLWIHARTNYSSRNKQTKFVRWLA